MSIASHNQLQSAIRELNALAELVRVLANQVTALEGRLKELETRNGGGRGETAKRNRQWSG